ncbi:MAG: phenylacetate--CoA ligase family protein [Limnochordia bacterium]|jgi:phenylacetate-CoA ligase
MVWNEIEKMDREQLGELQIHRLQATVNWVWNRVPGYRRRMEAEGIRPEDIHSLDDLALLPMTTKDDLRDNYPFGLFAVGPEEIVRVHASSGTTGKPTVVGYTSEDIGNWAEVMARTLVCGGATKNDTIQIAYGYGLFTGGLGVHYGAERLGATVIPTSAGHTKRQIMLMQDLKTTVLACTPSYALYLAETMGELGIAPRDLSLRLGVFGAEPWSDAMRKQIEAALGIDAIDIYGLSEIMGPGVASECLAKDGLHVFEDHFIAEVVDPVTGKPVEDGKQGELVFTTITKKGLPMIRYRTRDITILNRQPCSCGRTHARIKKVFGRTDDMLIVRGVNVFPSQIEEVLLAMGHTEPHYVLVVDRERGLDELEVRVELTREAFIDEVRRLEELERQIKRGIEGTLGIGVQVKLVEPKTIERSEGKAKRVIDRRELK